MKQQFITLLETISGVLTTAGASSEYVELSPEEQQFYDVLFLCYDLLTRTDISQSILVEQPEELKEPGFEEDFVQKYGVASSAIADFTFAICTRSGEVNLTELLYQVMASHVQYKIAQGVGIRQATISDFMTGKQSMMVSNYQKIINFCIQKKQ